MRHLVIIGNGFDLAHKLETSYIDFIKDIFNNEDEYNNLIEFKDDSIDYEQAISLIHKNSINYYVTFKNTLLEKFIKRSILENWSDVEEIYFNELNNVCLNYTKLKKEALELLNKEFDEIIISLKKYLNKILNNPGITYHINQFNIFFANLNRKYNETLILNFNYTNTLDYYIEGKDNIKKNDIHGQLDCEENPIIFGFAVNQMDSEKFLNTGEKEFTKYIKRYLYKKTNKEKALREFLDRTEPINVTIIGHSCGISDHLILNQIFTHQNVSKIRLMYFKNREEYLKQCFNIDRIVKDEVIFSKKIVDITESHRMPQFDDDQNKIIDFNDFLRRQYK